MKQHTGKAFWQQHIKHTEWHTCGHTRDTITLYTEELKLIIDILDPHDF